MTNSNDGSKGVHVVALRSLVIVTLCLAALSPRSATAQRFDVKTEQLTNGLKILMVEDASIPNVALYFFYRTGSRNERPGFTGLSHYFEHMMFNGAKKYGPGMFDRAMEDNGGANNAYTSHDLTVYQNWFPSTALPLILDLEADRISSLQFDPKMIESERGVVANERRVSVENNDASLLEEQLVATAFTAHPYQWPVVGWMSDIQTWKREDLMNYFKTYYAPNNCLMVIVGAFDRPKLLELVRTQLEPIPPQVAPPGVTTVEPEQLGERRVLVRKFAELPIVQVAYHSPPAAHADFVPLNVLEYILLWGKSSRLYQRLVDKDELAIEVSGGQTPHVDPYLFTVQVQPRDTIEPSRIEKALYEELNNVQDKPVTDRELQKAKNTALADFYRSIETISGKANVLGTYELLFGGYEKLFTMPEEIKKVTAEDVQRVARKYFSEQSRTVAILEPQPESTTEKKD